MSASITLGETVFGPKQYVRAKGGTTEFTDALTTLAGPAMLFIENGEWDGDSRTGNQVSSARISVNGTQIYGPNDFNQNVPILKTLINLVEENTLTVELNSKPNSFLTIKVTRPSVSINANPEIILLGDSSTLTWSSADVATCAIEPDIGPVAVNGSTAVTPIETTTYTITAIDPVGIPTTASQEVRVNHVPVAQSQSIATDEDIPLSLTLRGSDEDGDPLTFQTVSVPNHGALSGTLPDLTYSPNLNYNGPDTFTFIVNDGMVDSNPATIIITVNPINDQPMADAGPAQTVFRTDTVSLNGTGSDIDGDPLTYHWSFVSVPIDSATALSDPTISNTTFVADIVGVYELQLVVHDGTVASAPDSVAITANPLIVRVPDITGMLQPDAETAITEAGLRIGATSTAYSDTVPLDQVISQNPASGTSVEELTLVNMVLSLGPEISLPTVTIDAEPATIFQGDSTMLTWSSTNASSVSIDNGVGIVETSGSLVITPYETISYSITAAGPDGTAMDRVTVSVLKPLITGEKLSPSEPLTGGEKFGSTVDISGDTAIVGSPYSNFNEERWAGAAYIFKYDGSKWVETAKLTASDASWGDQFGSSVAISNNIAIVGARYNDDAE